MLAAINCEVADHPPCSFMIFGALLQQSASYLDFIARQLTLGLDAFVMLPPRPPKVHNDHYNLYGLPVSYSPEVTIEESVVQSRDGDTPLLFKTYHTPAGDLMTRVSQTQDWRWGDHVPFLDDYLIPRSKKFLVEGPEDLPAFQYLLVPPTGAEIDAFHQESAPVKAFAQEHNLLCTGGWGVGMDMIGWVHGLDTLIFDVYDRPDFVRDLFAMIAKWNRLRMEVILTAGIDLYIKRAWYENTDFFTPRIWKKLILPELRKDVQLAHQAGAKFGYIITANAMPLLELIAQAGVDVLIGVDPLAFDLVAVKAALDGRVCLWGGVNGHLTIEQGTSEAVKAEVTEAFTSLGPDGFILSPVDNVRENSPLAMDNITTLIQTWQDLTDQSQQPNS